MLAASEGHLNVVKFLIQTAKVDVGRSDRWGRTARSDALKFDHDNIVTFLDEQNKQPLVACSRRKSNYY